MTGFPTAFRAAALLVLLAVSAQVRCAAVYLRPTSHPIKANYSQCYGTPLLVHAKQPSAVRFRIHRDVKLQLKYATVRGACCRLELWYSVTHSRTMGTVIRLLGCSVVSRRSSACLNCLNNLQEQTLCALHPTLPAGLSCCKKSRARGCISCAVTGRPRCAEHGPNGAPLYLHVKVFAATQPTAIQSACWLQDVGTCEPLPVLQAWQRPSHVLETWTWCDLSLSLSLSLSD